jgi:3-hydroxyacyl-CoA dehydrogenase
VIGLHFFSPANVMRLLEMVRGAKTAPDVLATCMALAKKIKKIAVVSGVCDGFIGNRMLARYGAAAAGLLNAGACRSRWTLRCRASAWPWGPTAWATWPGLDIGWATRKRKAAEAGVEMKPVIADKLCEAGRFGQKTGAGWYRYEAGARDPIPDAVTQQIIDAYRAEHGITPRTRSTTARSSSAASIALVNEGARILSEGIAARAIDIDMVYLNGYGFPQHRGGPCCMPTPWACPTWCARCAALPPSRAPTPSWQPAPLLVQLAEAGKTFN